METKTKTGWAKGDHFFIASWDEYSGKVRVEERIVTVVFRDGHIRAQQFMWAVDGSTDVQVRDMGRVGRTAAEACGAEAERLHQRALNLRFQAESVDGAATILAAMAANGGKEIG